MSAANTILVVDDEPNLRTTLAHILQDEGYVVTTAANAKIALQYLQAGAYDLAFLDIQMPEVNGLTLLSQIREMYDEMPILILTAHASLESAIAALRHGANDYLFKPIDPSQILERISKILSQQQKPKRRREIFQEMKNLISELDQINVDSNLTEDRRTGGLTAVDPARFLQRGPICLDLHTHQVTVDGNLFTLTSTSFDYLVTLMRHSPEVVPCTTLVIESQNYILSQIEANEMSRKRIHELRKAIEPDPRTPQHIITVRGIGYRLVV